METTSPSIKYHAGISGSTSGQDTTSAAPLNPRDYMHKKVTKLMQVDPTFPSRFHGDVWVYTRECMAISGERSRQQEHTCSIQKLPKVLVYPSVGQVAYWNVKITPIGAMPEEKIACRHFAYAYTTRGKELFKDISEKYQLRRGHDIPRDRELNEIFLYKGCSVDALYFHIDQFSDALYDIACELRDSEVKSYMLFSINHAMSLRFEKRPGKGLVIYFYDPNDTLRHKKIILCDVEDSKLIKISDILTTSLKRYFPSGLEAGCLLSKNTVEQQKLCRCRYFSTEPTQGILVLLLWYGHYGHSSIPPDFFSRLNTEQKAGISDIGTPGLCLALQDGRQETVANYMHSVSESSLSLDEKKDLFAAVRKDKTPGLYMAMQHGHHRTVETYIHGILTSDLPQNIQKELLACRLNNGKSGLYISLLLGQKETVEVYVRTILNSQLKQDDKIELLAANNAFSVPALYDALRGGSPEAIKTYLYTVLTSNQLSTREQCKLLAAKSNDCTPGLYVAMQSGRTSAVNIYIESVLSSQLNENDKHELLEAMGGDRTPGLYMALKYGRKEIVSIYMDAVLKSQFDEKHKYKLLAASSIELPGLFWPMLSGYTGTTHAYLTAILTSDLPEQRKVALMQPLLNQKIPALLIVLLNANTGDINCYPDSITLATRFVRFVLELGPANGLSDSSICQLLTAEAPVQSLREQNSSYANSMKERIKTFAPSLTGDGLIYGWHPERETFLFTGMKDLIKKCILNTEGLSDSLRQQLLELIVPASPTVVTGKTLDVVGPYKEGEHTDLVVPPRSSFPQEYQESMVEELVRTKVADK